MYKIILVDDEKFFRDKFSKIIDWKQHGFELTGCFEDGKDAIEYLKSHRVDVVLTDIRMTFVSGVELSEYIFNNYPNTKVILNSGYSEFDYAKKAIEFGVVDYLLKPSKINEVYQALDKLKNQFDEKNAANITYDSDMQKLLIRQTLFDITNSVLTEKDAITERIRKIDADESMLHKPCAFLSFDISNFNIVIQNWKYSKSDLLTAIENILVDTYNKIADCYILGLNKNTYTTIYIFKDTAIDFGTVSFNEVLNNLAEILKIETSMHYFEFYNSIYEFAKSKDNDNLQNKITIIQDLFMQYINSQDYQTIKEIFNKFIHLLNDIDISLLDEKIRNFTLSLTQITKTDFEFINDELSYENKDIKIDIFKKNILNYIDRLFENRDKEDIILRAKKYIDSHYFEDITLENVADYVYLNRIYFCRYFKQITGENFSNYLTVVRMNKAIEFLKDPNIKIYEICDMIGYKTPRYFYKIFKNYTGLTPSEYRNKFLRKL